MSKNLSPEEKEAMRNYVLKLVVLPGWALSILMFIFGYLVNDVAKAKVDAESSKAYAESIKDASIRLHRLTVETAEAKAKAESAHNNVLDLLKNTEKINQDSQVLVKQISRHEELSKSINDQNKVASIIKKNLESNSTFKTDLINFATNDQKKIYSCPTEMPINCDAAKHCQSMCVGQLQINKATCSNRQAYGQEIVKRCSFVGYLITKQ